MTELRAYVLNSKDLLSLVRYQKKELAKAVGKEENILSST